MDENLLKIYKHDIKYETSHQEFTFNSLTLREVSWPHQVIQFNTNPKAFETWHRHDLRHEFYKHGYYNVKHKQKIYSWHEKIEMDIGKGVFLNANIIDYL